MRIVTLEEHVLTPAFAEARKHLQDGPPAELRPLMEPAMLDMDDGRLQAMDAAGITMQVLSMIAPGALEQLPSDEAAAIARDANNRVGEAIRRYPDRFAGFATLSLSDVPEAVTELRRAVEELGFCGVTMPGTMRHPAIDDEQFRPVWAEAERLGVPMYLHPTPPPPPMMQAYYTGLPERMGKLLTIAAWDWHAETALLVLRLIVSGIFDHFPGLCVVVGHMGADLPMSIARAGSVLDMMASQLQRPVEEYFHRHFWTTTSGYFTAESLHDAMSVVSADRMLFAINYPFSSTQRGRRFLDSLQLDISMLSKLAHANADQLFGWA